MFGGICKATAYSTSEQVVLVFFFNLQFNILYVQTTTSYFEQFLLTLLAFILISVKRHCYWTWWGDHKQKKFGTKTRFATIFSTLYSCYMRKKKLKTLFISTEWTEIIHAKEALGKEVARYHWSIFFEWHYSSTSSWWSLSKCTSFGGWWWITTNGLYLWSHG